MTVDVILRGLVIDRVTTCFVCPVGHLKDVLVGMNTYPRQIDLRRVA